MRIYVLDNEERPVPIGVAGELYIGGAGVARGYLNRPELTTELFLPDPFATNPDGRMYRTGDLARWLPDGNLEYIGRVDFQVKIRGFRIELGEIEAHLLAHPAVAQALVVLRHDDPDNPRLVAYWLADPSAPTPASAGSEPLRSFLAQRLPDYMVPAAFLQLETLPLTANGKLDRKALPAPSFSGDLEQRVEPFTDLERQLHAIWAELLGHSDFGIDDSFFAVGGHSLAVIRVLNSIRTQIGFDLSVNDFFSSPSIAALALHLQASAEQPGLESILAAQPQWLDGLVCYPASFAQSRLWFLHLLQPDHSAYHIHGLWQLHGELDPESLRLAFEHLLDHQQVLRTSYRLEADQVLQVVQPRTRFRIDQISLPTSTSPEALEALLQEYSQAPFDLRTAPMIRALCIEREQDVHLLLITVHHIASDGWSQPLLLQELSALYKRARHGEGIKLSPLEPSYADYSVWQRRQLAGTRREQLLRYWRQQLANLQPLNLPTDHPRPALPTHRGGSLRSIIVAERVAALEQLCSQQGATLQMGLLALVAMLLQRQSSNDDIPIAVPHWGRDHPGLEGMVGFFVNLLVLRCDLSGDPSFRELLQRVRRVSVEAYAHQDLPFEELAETLVPHPDHSRHPLTQVQVQLLDLPETSLNLEGLHCSPLPLANSTAKQDLSFYFRRRAGTLETTVSFSSDLFRRRRIERLLDSLQTLLHGVLAQPDRPISAQVVLAPEELSQLQRWGTGPSRPMPPLSLHQLFEQQVHRSPDAVAVAFAEETLSYQALNTRADHLASLLLERGARPGQGVGVCLERSLHLPVALLAVLRTGAAYVALDPSWPAQRLDQILQDSGLSLLVTDRQRAGILHSASLREVVVVEDGPAPFTAPSAIGIAWPVAAPRDPAYVLYTSGSTGVPKGVLVSQQAVVNRLLAMQQDYPLTSGDVVLQKASVGFDVSVWEIFWPLCVGARVQFARPDGQRDPDYLIGLIRAHQVTTVHFVPAMLALFLQHPEVGLCRSLRRVFTGGESLPRGVHDRFFKLLDAELHHLYGPTEGTIDVTAWLCHRSSDLPYVPIGRPLANVQLHLLGPDLNPVPIGAVGELFIGGVQVALGYLNAPDLTAERFLPDPFSPEPEARLFRTGDLCRWLSSGDLEFLGRDDDQVKIRGVRIELSEIEALLSRHPGVAQCVVVAEAEGENQRLVAYLTTEAEQAPDPVVMRQHMLALLPEVMVPTGYVWLATLPLTSNGKIDRRALVNAPHLESIERSHSLVSPQTPLQKQLHNLWVQLLGHDNFGIHDDFFMLGGHSLAAVRLAWSAQELGLQLSIGRIFANPTIAGLAAEAQDHRPPAPIPRLARRSDPSIR